MLNKLLSFLCIFLLSNRIAEAQKRICATMTHLESLDQKYPGSKAGLRYIDNAIEAQQKTQTINHKTGAVIITIPVVVHVIYNTSAQNVSDVQIQSQIDALNEDFAKLNADTLKIPAAFKPLAADTEIRFVLAKRDPNGDPTTGITRTMSSITAFQDNDAMKYAGSGGHDIWNRDEYLNIWVCRMSGGILGYAQFPGAGPVNTDGVVIDYKCFGRTGSAAAPFNKGRTATHEVGHWLGLYHIWADEPGCADDDQIADTPQQMGENTGCPNFPVITSSGRACAAGAPGAMFMNYMDYTDDACLYMFTNGQKTRMQQALTISRPSLFNSNGGQLVTVLNLDAQVFRILSPMAGSSCNTHFTPKVILKNKGNAPLTSATISYSLNGGTPQTYNWTGNLTTFATTEITLPAQTVNPGTHTFASFTNLPNGLTDNDTANDTASVTFTVNTPVVGLMLPLQESFETGSFPPAGWNLSNPDNGITWARTTAAAKTGSRSVYINNYDYEFVREADDLILPALNLTNVASPVLTFQVAYAMSTFSNTRDSLQVLASTDCGVTFSSLYKKGGNALATRTATSSPFTPAAAHWRTETINLDAFAGNNSVILKFRSVTGYDNNLYIDDINATASVLSNKPEMAASIFGIYPSPANDLIKIDFNSMVSGKKQVSIFSLTGQEIVKKDVSENSIRINLKAIPAGIYLVRVSTQEGLFTQKLILTK